MGATNKLALASNHAQSSILTHPIEIKTSTPSPSKTVKHGNQTVIPSSNGTVTPHNMTVMPSLNRTVAPHNMTVTPHNMTVTPSFNRTVTPHNMTVVPSHMISTVLNSSVMPPSTGSITPTPVSTVLQSSSVYPIPTLLPPAPGNFTVKNNGTVCLFAYMAAKFDVANSPKKLTFELPTKAKSTGECDTSSGGHPFIKLSWSTHSEDCSFTIHFEKFVKDLGNGVTHYWAATNLTFSLKINNSTTVFHSDKKNSSALSAGIGDAYACPSAPAINLTEKNSSVEITLTRLKFQPFGVKNGHFGNVTNCLLPSTPTVHSTTAKSSHPPKTTKQPESHTVAIAVGCSLAGLALVAVIGYLILRHRSRNNQAGYRKL